MASIWLQHVNVKVHARVAALDLTPAIDVFHRWIQNDYGDHLLLDVADHRHVPAGPGAQVHQVSEGWELLPAALLRLPRRKNCAAAMPQRARLPERCGGGLRKL